MLVGRLAVLGIDRLRRRAAAADVVMVVVVGIVVVLDHAVVLASLPEAQVARH